MTIRRFSALCLLSSLCGIPSFAQSQPKPLVLNDPKLKVECLASYPDVEACTTVAASPDGAVFVGNDPRDGRLNTAKPECTIVKYTGTGADRKRTVFATGLYSPAGMVWHDGWLYVVHDPLLTRFKDTDGDGVADVREDLVTNLGIPPYDGLNDHVVSGIAVGMDGFLYISSGDRGILNATGKDGSQITLWGGGIVRCRPDGTQLEVFSGGTRNHLEVDLDAFDRAFTNDNTDDGNGWWTRVTHHIESGYYGYPFYFKKDATNGMMKAGPIKPQFLPGSGTNELFLPAMTDFGGGSPTGGLCYLSDGLPEEYRGKLFFSEWGRGNVFMYDAAREGATFKYGGDKIVVQAEKGTDFRPMELAVAADGSLLIADWQWGGWKGPKTVGAVWRVSWPDAKPAARLRDETKAPTKELIAALNHPDRDQRLRAEWALVKRGESTIPALIEVLHDGGAPAVKKAHAIWAMDLIGDGSPELRSKVSGLIRQVLADSDAVVRAQAVRELALRHADDATAELIGLLKDSDPEVRLQSAIGLGRMAAKSATPALLKTLGDEDRWVRYAVRVAVAKIGEWPLVAPELKTQDSRIREQAWLAIGSVYQDSATEVLTQLAHDTDAGVRALAVAALGHAALLPMPYDGHWWGTQPVKNPQPLSAVPWSGTEKAIDALVVALADGDASVREAAAEAFAQIQLSGPTGDAAAKLPKLSAAIQDKAFSALRARLTADADPAVKRQLIETLGIQHDPQAMKVFTSIALDEKADPDFRRTAIVAVGEIGGDEAKKTIAQLAGADLGVPALLPLLDAAARLRVTEAAPALIARLKHSDPKVREAAVKAIAAIGPKANAADALIEVLNDKDGHVQIEAVKALGSLRARQALPQLIALAEKHRYQRETLEAIASMPDSQSIPVLLTALADKNPGTRRIALKALKGMRNEVWPTVQERLASGAIPKEYESEIRSYFESGVIQKWKMLGPFENVWGAVHPPEKDALAAGGKADLSRKYVNAEGKEVGWRDESGDAAAGHVNLGKVFQNNGMVCAYAYTEFEAPEAADAKILCGSDDQIAIWLNGRQVHDFGASRGYEADKDEVPVHVDAGVNRLLVKIGNIGGDWEFAMRMPGLEDGKFVKAKEAAPDEKQRTFALAAKPDGAWLHAGDPAYGEKLFHDQSAGLGGVCATCHTVRGKGGQVGPDLTAIGVNYKRQDLVTSVLEPSRTIALGFETVMIETKGGDTFVGAIRSDVNDELKIVGVDGMPHLVKHAEVKKRTDVKTSMMPQGLTLALKPEDFVDLISYLETLRGN